MADPILNNVVRAQCIWKAPSGLPTDVFVTSWAFVRDTVSSSSGLAQSEQVADRLREFWLDPVAPNGAVSGLLPGAIVTRGLEIRTYDLGESPPREPRIYNYPVPGGGSGDAGLPREVAVCLSFYATRNLPRQRGRVYIGPLTGTSVGTSAGGVPVVAPLVRDRIAAAANRLANGTGVGDSMRWGVLSQVDQEIRRTTNGWVDDAFDTIRSRGQEPLVRTTWGPA